MDLKDSIDRIAEFAGQAKGPEIIKVPHKESGKELTVLITRDHQGGMRKEDLTDRLAEFDANPARHKGTASFETLESMIDHINRFKRPCSALFATRTTSERPFIECVLDYHDAINDDKGKARADALPHFREHRSAHSFPLSEEFKKWRKISEREKPLDTEEFSFFLEDNIIDVMFLPEFLRPQGKAPETTADKELLALIQKLDGKPCGPEKLMQLAKGLQVNEDTKIQAFFDRNSGQAKIGFQTEHTDASGNTLDVPNMFLISIPVFNGDQPYRIPVRLRYRARAGTVVWMMEMHRPDIFLEDAFNLACEKAANETGLPLFFGKSE